MSKPPLEDVCEYLISADYTLAALELFAELAEDGIECPQLKDFVERASGMSLGDVVPAKKMANAKELEEAHDALARVEYELRVAREDLAETKGKLAQAEHQLQAPLAAGVLDATSITAVDGENRTEELGDEKAMNAEVRKLNAMVSKYLLARRYALSSITFSEEAGDINDDAAAGMTLLSLLRSFSVKGQGVSGTDDAEERSSDEQSISVQLVFEREEKKRLELQVRTLQKEIEITKNAWKTETRDLKKEVKRLSSAVAAATSASMPVDSQMSSPTDISSVQQRALSPVNRRDGPGEGATSPLPQSTSLSSDRVRAEYDRCSQALEDCLNTLTPCIHAVVPNVLVAKRNVLFPAIRCLFVHHPDSSSRHELVRLMLSSVKRPEPEFVTHIASAISALAEAISEERVCDEILPCLSELLPAKHPECRVVVAASVAAVAPRVHSTLRESLLLSFVEALVCDREVSVRMAGLNCLHTLLPLLTTYGMIPKLLASSQQLMRDADASIAAAAKSAILPALADWAVGAGTRVFVGAIFLPLVGQLDAIFAQKLESCVAANHSCGDAVIDLKSDAATSSPVSSEGSSSPPPGTNVLNSSSRGATIWAMDLFPSNFPALVEDAYPGAHLFLLNAAESEQALALASIIEVLLPRLVLCLLLSGPFAKYSISESAMTPEDKEAHYSVLLSQCEEWVNHALEDSTDGVSSGFGDSSSFLNVVTQSKWPGDAPKWLDKWEGMHVIRSSVVPTLLRLSARLHPINLTLWLKVASLMHKVASGLGPVIIKHVVAPLMEAAISQPKVLRDGRAIFGLGGITGSLFCVHQALTASVSMHVLRANPAAVPKMALVAAAENHLLKSGSWSVLPPSALSFAAALVSQGPSYSTVFVTIKELSASPQATLRRISADLCRACLPLVPLSLIRSTILPALSSLASDADEHVRTSVAHAAAAIFVVESCDAAAVEVAKDIISGLWIQSGNESSRTTESSASCCRACAALVPVMKRELRDSFVLVMMAGTHIPLAEKDANAMSIVAALCDAYNRFFDPDLKYDHTTETVTSTLLPGLQSVASHAERVFGKESRQLVSVNTCISACNSVTRGRETAAAVEKPKKLWTLGGRRPSTIMTQGLPTAIVTPHVASAAAAVAASVAAAATPTSATPSTPSKVNDISDVTTGNVPTPPIFSSANAPASSSKSKGGFFGTFEGAINRLSAFEKQAMSKERERKAAAADSTTSTSTTTTQHTAIPIIEMDSDHSDPAGEAGSHGSRTPSAGHTDGEESASHSETSSAAGSGDESDSSASRTSRASVDIDRKDTSLPRRLSDPPLQLSNRPPSPATTAAATAPSGKKESKRGSMFGNLFDKKDKDKETSGSGATLSASSSSTEGETVHSSSASSSSSRFKLTGNFFDKKDKDAKGAHDFKEKEKEGESASAATSTDNEASAASSTNGSGTSTSTTAAHSSTFSGSRFKLNLNLGFGSKSSAPAPGTDDSSGAGK